MGRMCLCVTLVLVPILHAQSITGTWQATLPIENAPRVVLRLTKAADGSLQGTFYRLDWTAAMPVSALSFAAPDLQVTIAVTGNDYRAKLDADGKSFHGIWQQDKKSYPLDFALATPATLWSRETEAPLGSMSETADPTFEVAVIKPGAPGARQTTYALGTRHFNARNATVFGLMRFAYGIQSRQIEGAPDWFNELRFDIDAEPDKEGLPSEQQYRKMVGKLLADRFALKVHSIQKIFPIYSLTIGPDHSKLIPTDTAFNLSHRILTRETADDQMLLQFIDHTMPDFIDILMSFVQERQIVDETGLTGAFDFSMTVAPAALRSSDGTDKATEIFRSVEPLGFKLIPKRGPIEVLVIDHLDKPSAN
jgi:uncharacterized protein (TIGR03435 family)